ncbi:MAG: hypothetical protein ISS65_06835 [Desulfobacterales bacterium]|uniref:Uncharacterized protein n=1 Tax=Candidatus Desulfatibia profunda TaxID=2841695 RepID=A0A8J6NVA7_9BACT|nr:hypothetical protein [Candidatus Desulfatibia profunda]MBL7179912.1 hypothetical protein [Desulfobacterales bacterium]
MLSEWILFEDASYLVERAFIVAPDNTAVALEKALITINTGKKGKKHLSGSGLVRNELLVELLEESDELDLILDLGGEFKYRLKTPKISAGKVFSPKVKSTLQFAPTSPWDQIPESEFEKLLSRLKFL